MNVIKGPGVIMEMMQNLDTYRSMLDVVPSGSVSVPAVLQAMFEQVAHTIEQEKREAIASTTPNEPVDAAPTLQTYIQQAWNGLSPPTTTEQSAGVEGNLLNGLVLNVLLIIFIITNYSYCLCR